MGKVNSRFSQPRQPSVLAKIITNDHKPDDKMEKQRIEALGGSISKSRVVWECTKIHGGVSVIEKIPLLNMARSLGDLWSVTINNQYLISPVPDVHVYNTDTQDLFLVVASDGLWDMLSPQKVVEKVHKAAELNNIIAINEAAHSLISEALCEWKKCGRMADNISIIICVFSNQQARHCEQPLRMKPPSSSQSTNKDTHIVPEFQAPYQQYTSTEEQLFYG